MARNPAPRNPVRPSNYPLPPAPEVKAAPVNVQTQSIEILSLMAQQLNHANNLSIRLSSFRDRLVGAAPGKDEGKAPPSPENFVARLYQTIELNGYELAKLDDLVSQLERFV